MNCSNTNNRLLWIIISEITITDFLILGQHSLGAWQDTLSTNAITKQDQKDMLKINQPHLLIIPVFKSQLPLLLLAATVDVFEVMIPFRTDSY